MIEPELLVVEDSLTKGHYTNILNDLSLLTKKNDSIRFSGCYLININSNLTDTSKYLGNFKFIEILEDTSFGYFRKKNNYLNANITPISLDSLSNRKSIHKIKSEFVVWDETSLKEWLFKTKFKNKIINLIKDNKIDSALDVVFNEIEDALVNGEFSLIDSLLMDEEILRLDTNVLICILTVTLNWKNSLSQRSAFYYSVANIIHLRFHEEEAIEILSGLE